MDIRHLLYFREVALTRSFTKAAHTSSITQPTMSKMIKDLENELDVDLFTRIGKRVAMTDAGSLILPQVQRIIDAFNELTVQLDDFRHVRTGRLKIGLPPMIGANFFPKVLAEFHDHFPLIDIELMEAGGKAVEQGVADGSLQLGVVALPVSRNDFLVSSFFRENLRVLVAKNHPLHKHHRLSLSALQKERFILFHEDFALHDMILAHCEEVGFVPNILCKSSQWDFIVRLVAQGLGVALLPETICQEAQDESVASIALNDPVIPWHLGFVWRKNASLSFAAKAFLDLAQAHFS